MPSSAVLLHACCVHCSAYTAQHWAEQGYAVTFFWYNPNIHPLSVHQKRLEALQLLAQKQKTPLIITEGYDMPEYFKRVSASDEKRCAACFGLRLEKTAREAARMGIEAFTSSLLISPHQDHELARKAGVEAAALTGVEFIYTDLRKRYSDSRHITKPMELYRQQYCGCLYSEWERYRD